MKRLVVHSQLFFSTEVEYADVVIAGGGMVGTSLACALGNSEYMAGKEIRLLEASSNPGSKNWNELPYENRVSAITPGSKNFLEEIGVWSCIKSRRYNTFGNMKVWDGNGSVSLNSDEMGFQNMAYMVENSVIVESCSEIAASLKNNVSIDYNAKISKTVIPSTKQTSSSLGESLVDVHLENGNLIKTKLLVGADGFNSFVRQQADLKTYDYDYKQSAVVGTLHVQSEGENSTAWQRYLTSGPVALLPMSNNVSSLVWSTGREEAKRLMKVSDEQFVDEVNQTYARESNLRSSSTQSINDLIFSIIKPGSNASSSLSIPPVVTSVEAGSRGMFPLMLKHAVQYVKSRTVLIGDAAHRIHPMAGQGVNLGFGDVKCLVKTIENSIICGKDFGSLENLLSYETERQRHVVSIIAAINTLNALFSSTLPPVVMARGLGMQITDALPMVKERIVMYAMS